MKRLFYLIVIITTSIVGCNKDNGLDSQSQMKFINASINAPTLEIEADGVLLATDVVFPSASNYFFVKSGRPNFRIKAKGKKISI